MIDINLYRSRIGSYQHHGAKTKRDISNKSLNDTQVMYELFDLCGVNFLPIYFILYYISILYSTLVFASSLVVSQPDGIYDTIFGHQKDSNIFLECTFVISNSVTPLIASGYTKLQFLLLTYKVFMKRI